MILSTLATSQQAATALVNALQHVNREKESVTVNERVQLYLGRVKVERKKVVRYSESASAYSAVKVPLLTISPSLSPIGQRRRIPGRSDFSK
jgi:hypothetical protein